MTKVTIDRELLERIAKPVLFRSDEDAHADACAELRVILAAPRQPEGGDGLEVVGWHHSHAEVATSDKARVVTWLPECVEPLCRLSDAKRAIAELREEMTDLHRKLDKFYNQSHGIPALAEIERLRAERDTLRQQRDKLAQILRDLMPGCKWRIMRPRIDAALAEVKPCPESPAPTT